MRWLASRPPWRLAAAWVLLLSGVVLGSMLTIPDLTYAALFFAFFLFLATLMALVDRRGTPQPRSPH
jgi:uncharacterized membrane protein YoaK (UPF0700 family)